MDLLVTVLLVAILSGALVLMLRLCQALMQAAFWAIILLVVGWVIAHILIISWLGKLGQDSALLRAIYRAWYGFFYYTAPLQGLLFTVLAFWSLAALLNPVYRPDNMEKFVLDFITGSSYLAGLIFILGLGVFALVIGEIKGFLRFLDVVYIVVGTAILTVPWIFKGALIVFMQRHSPQLAFWIAIGVYALLSAAGMRLAMGPLIK